MKVSIASDHAGFEEKELLKPYLVELGHEVIDRGPDSDDRVDYPDFARLVAKDVAGGEDPADHAFRKIRPVSFTRLYASKTGPE